MKKLLFVLALALCATKMHGQTLTAVASTKGIAPIPAFNLPEPAGLIFLNTKITNNLEFSPDFTYSLKDGKGWFLDTWLRYNVTLDSAKRWVATAGYDWSFFFQPYTANGEAITQTVRYPTYQARLKFIQNAESTFTFDYWYTYPIERAHGITGSYISIMYSRTKELQKVVLSSNPNLFYISYSDGTKGFLGSIDFSCAHKKSGLFVSTQLLKPITANNSRLVYNFSIGITRKLY